MLLETLDRINGDRSQYRMMEIDTILLQYCTCRRCTWIHCTRIRCSVRWRTYKNIVHQRLIRYCTCSACNTVRWRSLRYCTWSVYRWILIAILYDGNRYDTVIVVVVVRRRLIRYCTCSAWNIVRWYRDITDWFLRRWWSKNKIEW